MNPSAYTFSNTPSQGELLQTPSLYEALPQAVVLAGLRALALYPTRHPPITDLRHCGGPLIALVYSPVTGRPVLRVDFELAGRRYFVPELLSSGRSRWTKEQTHRLTEGFAARFAAAVAANPEGRAKVKA